MMQKLQDWAFYSAAVIAVGAALLVVLSRHVVIEVPLKDKTMRPAIGAEETHFTVDTSWVEKPGRGSAVAFVPPGKGRRPRVARAVALEGDTIEVGDGRLLVNGKSPKGPGRRLKFAAGGIRVPRDSVYVLVDVKSGRASADSLDFGPLPMWRVLGSVAEEED
jgi:signal peptidase I